MVQFQLAWHLNASCGSRREINSHFTAERQRESNKFNTEATCGKGSDSALMATRDTPSVRGGYYRKGGAACWFNSVQGRSRKKKKKKKKNLTPPPTRREIVYSTHPCAGFLSSVAVPHSQFVYKSAVKTLHCATGDFHPPSTFTRHTVWKKTWKSVSLTSVERPELLSVLIKREAEAATGSPGQSAAQSAV